MTLRDLMPLIVDTNDHDDLGKMIDHLYIHGDFLSSVMVDPTNDRKRVEKAGDTALFFSLVWQETMAARPVGIVNSPHGR